MSVVLDTNALIWLLKGSDRLGRRAARRIDDALRSTRVLISASSFWEVAVLVAKNRLALDQPIDRWRVDALQLGIEEVPIDGELAIASVGLTDLHADPADRFIMATAIRTSATLVTSDARLLAWKGPLARIDARV
ncbi:MAG TPA: type II toxin-antitoxin system VapC family toxin [Reyranella sp.]|jgi:PIN domain nuclease of toxin-antitoxin system|nr:type II toxin-antitoxin system VapC family toxin [Reyranella sp.]